MRLDHSKPYAHVHGLGGVAWQQDGRYFAHNGAEVSGDPDQERRISELRSILSDFSLSKVERDAARVQLFALVPEERGDGVSRETPVARPTAMAPSPHHDDLRLAENKRLKAELDVYGEPWTTAAAARAFLAGRAEEPGSPMDGDA